MILPGSCFKTFLLPVSIDIGNIARVGRIVSREQRLTTIYPGFIDQHLVLSPVSNISMLPNFIPTIITAIINSHWGILPSLPGSDDNYSISSFGTIDGRSGCIFQDLHGFYVIRTKVPDGISNWHSIHHIERLG